MLTMNAGQTRRVSGVALNMHRKGHTMKTLARIVGVAGVLLALLGVIGRGMGLRAIHCIVGGFYTPKSFLLLGMLGVVIGTWLAVAFDAEKK